MNKEVMEQALSALLSAEDEMNCEYGVTELLRQAIAQSEKQEQGEPVGKFAKFNDGIWREVTVGSSGVLLYTHPKEWVGLTDEDIEDCYIEELYLFAVALEARLKEKNS